MEICVSHAQPSGAGTLRGCGPSPRSTGVFEGRTGCSTTQNINRRSFGMIRTRAMDQNREMGCNGRGPVISAMAALEMQEQTGWARAENRWSGEDTTPVAAKWRVRLRW
jgi:hypothetical protein